jgi:hypothetical protein
LFVDALGSRDDEHLLGNEMKTLSLNELNNDEDLKIEDEEENNKSSDEDGKSTYSSAIFFDYYQCFSL